MSEELKVKKERVLDAADLGYQQKELLETLFPKAFEKPKLPEFDLSKLNVSHKAIIEYYHNIFSGAKGAGFIKGLTFSVRASGNYKNKAFYLDKMYDWKIIEDDSGALVLAPGHKEEK